MVRKLVTYTAALAFLGLIACSTGGGDDGPSAPKVPAVNTLPATGAESTPVGQTAAIELLNETLNVFMTELEASGVDGFTEPDSNGTPVEATISWTGAVGVGTVDFSGKIKYSTKYPSTFTPTANTTYNNLIQILFGMELSGTLENVTLINTTTEHTYAVSGTLIDNSNIDMNVDVITGSDEASTSANIDFSYTQEYGAALSIRRNDGLGAKFVFTFAHEVSQQDISTVVSQEADYAAALGEELASDTVNIKVYNDSNVEIGSYDVPLSALRGTTDLLDN